MEKNKELFDRANATNDAELRTKLRNNFLAWCQENGRTPLNTQSTLDWWELESEV